MIKHVLLIIAFSTSCLVLSQLGNSWDKRESFGGLKREKAVAFSIDNLGYVSCGVDTAEITHNDLWSYDPTTDSWTQLASIPASERRNAIAFSINGKGYVGTGFSLDDGDLGTKLKDFWEYNPLVNNWTERANYPGGGDTGIYQASAFAILNKGYVVCGKIGSDAYIPEMWQYDPFTDNWTPRTPFPGGDRYQLVSFTLEGHAFVGLGTDHDVLRKDMHEYDPVTNTWEDLADFPGTERAQSSSFSIGVNGYVLFGSDGGLKDELWEYNFYTKSWIQRAPFPGGGRISAIAFSLGDKGYAGLGKEVSGKKQSFYEYTPAGPLSIQSPEKFEWSIYPNPMQTETIIQLPIDLNKGELKLFSADGRELFAQTISNGTLTISRGSFTTGLYYLVVIDEIGNVLASEKLIIQ